MSGMRNHKVLSFRARRLKYDELHTLVQQKGFKRKQGGYVPDQYAA